MIRLVALMLGLLLPLAAQAERVSVCKGAKLRGLDKVTGEVQDIEVMNGEVARMGRIMIALGECRYPVGNPSGDAYAFLAVGKTPAMTRSLPGG